MNDKLTVIDATHLAKIGGGWARDTISWIQDRLEDLGNKPTQRDVEANQGFAKNNLVTLLNPSGNSQNRGNRTRR